MVIAELFSTEVSENVLAALCLQPEKLIFLGSRSGLALSLPTNKNPGLSVGVNAIAEGRLRD